MKGLAGNFAKGLLVIVPIAVTGYVAYSLFLAIDRLNPFPVPGAGVILAILFITFIGFLTTNVVGRRALGAIENLFSHIPVMKILYGSLKDLMGAFAGDKKSFDKPVLVDFSKDGAVKAMGFVTCERFDDPALSDHVAVYLPQSYNFSGALVVVPRDRVHPMDADGAQFLAFVLSGGVAEMHGARTVYDGSSLSLPVKKS